MRRLFVTAFGGVLIVALVCAPGTAAPATAARNADVAPMTRVHDAAHIEPGTAAARVGTASLQEGAPGQTGTVTPPPDPLQATWLWLVWLQDLFFTYGFFV